MAISAYICVHGGLYDFNPVGGWIDMGIVVLRWRWDRADDATDVDAKVQSEILATRYLTRPKSGYQKQFWRLRPSKLKQK